MDINRFINYEDYKKELLNSGNSADKITKFLTPYFPKKLYKYGNFKSDHWEKTMFKGQVYLAKSNSFNDPFDCLPYFDINTLLDSPLIRKLVMQRQPSLEEADFFEDNREQIHGEILQGLREEFRASCFSEKWDSILMWGHYADCHKGFCIEYDLSSLSELKKSKLFPVLYQKDPIDITHDMINLTPNAGLISIVSKAQEWSYEKEWRMVTLHSNSSESFYFRKEIKAIILGLDCEQVNRDKVFDWAKKKGKEVFQTKISSGKYEIIKERLI